MTPKTTVVAAGATLALAFAATAPAHHGHQHLCSSLNHNGYRAYNIKAEHLNCHNVHTLVRHVIEHGTGRLHEHGWLCYESASTDGSGVAGCHVEQHRFSFSFKPHH